MSDWIQFLRDENTKKSYKTFKQELEGERAYIKRKNIFDKVKQFKKEEKANELEAENLKNLYYDGIVASTFFKDRIPATKLRQLEGYRNRYNRLTGKNLTSTSEVLKDHNKRMKKMEKEDREKERLKREYEKENPPTPSTPWIIPLKKGRGVL